MTLTDPPEEGIRRSIPVICFHFFIRTTKDEIISADNSIPWEADERTDTQAVYIRIIARMDWRVHGSGNSPVHGLFRGGQ